MNYRLNPNVILRQEFFGGFIHSRWNGDRWELPAEDGIFLWVLDRVGDVRAATRITQDVFPGSGFAPDVPSFQAEGFLEEGSAEGGVATGTDAEDVAEAGRLRLSESRGRTYLRAPTNLSLYPLMACQLDCKFCYVSNEKWTTEAEPPEKWLRIMREAREMGIPFISLLGGDASLYPHVHCLVRACDDLGIKGSITTNGLSMRPSLFAALVETKLITPTISVQALNGFHEEITGRSPAGTLETVRRLRRAGKDCNLNLVYTGQSDRQVLDVVDFCLEQGVGKMSVGVFVNVNGADVPVPAFSQYRRLHERVLEHLESQPGATLAFQVEGCQLYTAYPDYVGDPVESRYEQLVYGCEAGNGRFEIMSDGTGLPCALLNKDLWGGGNVFELGLQRVWDTGHSLHRIRSYRNPDGACRSCRFGHFCNGGCPAMNERTYGSIERFGDARCEIRQELIARSPARQPIPLKVIR